MTRPLTHPVKYADIEAILEHLPTKVGVNTQHTHKHTPCAVGCMIISRIPNNRYHGKYVEFVGPTCMTQFLDYCEEVLMQVFSWATNFETRCVAQRTPLEQH